MFLRLTVEDTMSSCWKAVSSVASSPPLAAGSFISSMEPETTPV